MGAAGGASNVQFIAKHAQAWQFAPPATVWEESATTSAGLLVLPPVLPLIMAKFLISHVHHVIQDAIAAMAHLSLNAILVKTTARPTTSSFMAPKLVLQPAYQINTLIPQPLNVYFVPAVALPAQ